ncbi:SH3 domain-containing protein [Henriciella aquimarina]|uniref:SH3 domain-containing protein n=1 Tax=Henriciella aquimarina TaxID=545261 RepID=UPI0009FF236F|nr:SH3 domain-containing protein [Henriciella aquimarina]
MKFLVCSLLWACLILTGSAFATAEADPEPVRISQFSGKPVPRFESLRYSAVHGRRGPSKDHEIVWRYERQGMPVLVVKETRGWSQIRDADGDETWVQTRMLSDSRHALLLTKAVLRKRPNELSRGIASVQAGVVAELTECEEAWCRIKADRFKGWVEQADLWGVETRTDGL